MWELKRIPKKLHLYWGRNRPLSYMRYLTALTFRKLNPEWEILVYYPRNSNKKFGWFSREHYRYFYQGEDYFESLKDICTLKEIDDEEYSFIGGLTEVHKSDLLRWKLLYQVGGCWSDFDIIYIKSMDSLSFNLRKNRDTDAVVCYQNLHKFGGTWNAIGFLLSGIEEDYSFFRDIYNSAMKFVFVNKLAVDHLDYQALGRGMMDKHFPLRDATECNIINAPFDSVYPVFYFRVSDYFIPNGSFRKGENTIGLHWYAGHPISSNMEGLITTRKSLLEQKHLPIFADIAELV